MCDTFAPLRLTRLSEQIDDGAYALSWATDASGNGVAPGVGARVPSDAGTSHG
jgi:hypothetical protein